MHLLVQQVPVRLQLPILLTDFMILIPAKLRLMVLISRILTVISLEKMWQWYFRIHTFSQERLWKTSDMEDLMQRMKRLLQLPKRQVRTALSCDFQMVIILFLRVTVQIFHRGRDSFLTSQEQHFQRLRY